MKVLRWLPASLLAALAWIVAAEEPDLVPRRLFVTAVIPPSVADAPQLARAADTLFAAVAARVPVVRVQDASLAQSRLEVRVSADGAGYLVSAALFDGERQALSREAAVARGAAGFADYAAFVRDASQAFAPLLPMVRPQVVMGDAAQEARYRDVAQETDFAAQLARRWELTLWGSGLSELYHEPVATDSHQIDVRPVPVLPLSFDAAWYYSRNGGLIASLYFDYGDFVGLGVVRSGDVRLAKASSTNLFLLPGAGITYRTLSAISAQFATIFYFGPVHVSAVDDIPGIAAAGEDVWTPYFMMSLSSALSWNITPRVSLKTRMAVNVDMLATFLGGLSNRDTYAPVTLQFFTLGIAYRP